MQLREQIQTYENIHPDVFVTLQKAIVFETPKASQPYTESLILTRLAITLYAKSCVICKYGAEKAE